MSYTKWRAGAEKCVGGILVISLEDKSFTGFFAEHKKKTQHRTGLRIPKSVQLNLYEL